MLSDEVIEKVTERLVRRIEQGNEYVLTKIGESVKKIGTLTPNKAQELVQVLKYGGDYDKIVKKLAEITKLNVRDIYKIFEEVEYNTSSKLRLSNNAIYVGKNVNTILVNAQWNAWGSNGNSRYIYIRKNGTEVTFVSRAYTATLQSQVILPVEEGDYIELFCYTEQSGTTTITNGFMQTFMQVTILG